MTMHHAPGRVLAAEASPAVAAAIARPRANARIADLLAGGAATSPKVALLRRLAHNPGRLHPRGAELELRNLAERIELRIGEQVGGRLHERERDEHDAVRHRVVLAGGELYRAAAGGDAHHVARRDAEPGKSAARDRGDRRGRERGEQ